MGVIVDTRNEQYYIVTLGNGNTIRLSKRVNTDESVWDWLIEGGAKDIKWIERKEEENVQQG